MSQRYLRQMSLPEVGTSGQAAISSSEVVLSERGWFSEVASIYLKAAGVGSVVPCDSSESIDSSGSCDSDWTNDIHDETAREFARGAHVALERLRAILGVS